MHKPKQGRNGVGKSVPDTVNTLLQQAIVHHQAGRLAPAQALYRQILDYQPRHADALHLLGVLAEQSGDAQAAITSIEQAIAAQPERAAQAAYYFSLAGAQMTSGAREAALESYRQVLARNPAHFAARVNFGLALQERGDLAEAVAQYRLAEQVRADVPELYNNLGNALQAQGDYPAAQAALLRALTLRPDYAQAHNNLGNTLKAQQHYALALTHFQQALTLKPDYLEAHFNRGNVLEAQGELDAALAAYRQALTLNPNFYPALNNAGHILKEQGKLTEAIATLQRAIALRPDDVEAYNNLGNALKAQGNGAAAVACYRRALELAPQRASTYYNLGNTLQDMGAYEAAVAAYRQALARQPDYVEVFHNLGSALSSQGKAAAALACLRHALDLQPDFDLARSSLLFHLNYESDCPPAEYLAEARRFGASLAQRAQPYTAWPKAEARDARLPLRVGLVSGDLRMHPVGYFLESVLAHLLPNRIELHAYVTGAQEDALTARLKPRFTGWRSLMGLSDAAAAAAIHADGIQILIDLAGHTLHNRLPVFAWKPAPVQVAWLGYFASTGLDAIDYILADRYVLPPAEQAHFVEQAWRLPDSYLCFTPPTPDVAVGPLPLLATGTPTFGCFNRLSKLNDAVIDLWVRVLQAAPQARLLLKAKELLEPSAQAATRARFVARGIAAERILTEGYTPRTDYLDNYNRVDIALDPFPFPGGTTTVEALWMGVPVLTLRGDRFLSHAGESLLHTAGLSTWIAADADEYVAKACAYVHDVSALAACRAGLRARLLASPLCDAPRFAGHLETAWLQMWQHHVDHG